MANQPTNYRKFVVGAASAALVASAVAPVAFAAEFTDVKDNNSHKVAIGALSDAGVISGYPDGTFQPNKTLTRSDVVKMMGKWLIAQDYKVPTDYKTNPRFTDLTSNSNEELLQMAALVKDNGVFNGNDGKLLPADNITRENMAVVLVRALDTLNDFDLAAYVAEQDWKKDVTDLNKAKSEARPAIDVLDFFDITNPAAPEFNPKSTTTRGQFASFLYKAAGVDYDEVKNPVGKVEVESVTAINATQVEVKFDVEVVGGTNTEANLNTNYKIGAVSPAKAVLQADKKTVLLTFANASEVEVKDAVFVVEPIATAKDASVKTAKFTKVFSYEDTVRPSVTSTTYTDFQNAVIHFSEPMSSLGTVTVSNPNVVVGQLAADGMSVPVSLSAAAEGSYTVTMVGASDKSNNLITPNPVTVNLVKSKTDTVAPVVAGVTTSGTSNLSVKFSEALASVPAISVTGSTIASVTQDLTDATKYNVVLTTPVTGVQTVSVAAGYKDTSGNAGAAYSSLVQFTADTTAPEYASHSVQTINGVQYLVVAYNEALATAAGTVSGSYVDANSVTRSATLGAVSLHDVNGDGSTEAVKIVLTDNIAGNYTVNLPAALVQDASSNKSAAKSVSFTLGSAVDNTKPAVSGLDTQVNTNNANKISVHFSNPVTAATALNTSNYTVEGENVFSSAIFDGSQQKVTLTLKEGTITTDGLRNFAVNNVSGVNGTVMNAHTEQVVFKENVKPTLTSANLVAANSIALNFSELLDSATIAGAGAGNDFEVVINGTKATIANVAAGADASKYVITLDNATVVKNLSDTVTVNVLNTNDVTDASTPANKLKTTGSITVAK